MHQQKQEKNDVSKPNMVDFGQRWLGVKIDSYAKSRDVLDWPVVSMRFELSLGQEE